MFYIASMLVVLSCTLNSYSNYKRIKSNKKVIESNNVIIRGNNKLNELLKTMLKKVDTLESKVVKYKNEDNL